MATLTRRWHRYWFAPATPTNLGVCRLLFFGLVLLRYRIVPIDASDAAAWAEVPRVFWIPNPLLGRFVFPLLPGDALRLLEMAWTTTLAMSCIGCVTRASTAVAFLLGTYLLWLPHNFGKLHHMDGMVVLVMGVLALSRCGDAWSLDSWLRLRRKPSCSVATECGEYTWPIRIVWVIMATVFVEAGMAKLRNGGLAWITSDNLSLMLIKANYRAYTGIPPLTSFGLYLAQSRWLCEAAAALTVGLEIGYPLALVSRRLRILWVPATFLVVVGMFVMIVPAFVELIGLHVFWVPWGRIGVPGRLRLRTHQSANDRLTTE